MKFVYYSLPSCSFRRTACLILPMSMCRLPNRCTCSVVLSSSGLATRSLELGSTRRFVGSRALADEVERLRVEPRTYSDKFVQDMLDTVTLQGIWKCVTVSNT